MSFRAFQNHMSVLKKSVFWKRFCLPWLSLVVLLSISGRNTADDGSAATDRVVILLLPLKGFYSATGRPSIDPEVLLRLLVVGYLYGITFFNSGTPIERTECVNNLLDSANTRRVHPVSNSPR
jgi:hypothetical protein